ncbi:response regulator NasT [Parvularcula bermudensis HTCC2503]|uniref:Response regulator NasT n=1 Tax=Parvularcula bermudensis (strain ATCC BAA-594 / HTCC2503 / KCTC 12087) TaxID=314260 RepID=E0THG1_PARBH|nr:ANTAR domain-containing protein [Parvularcula bermudensis]ADM10753.1 response regulator NasT [Parvularcula bermudensis HTCC2503]
MSEAQTPPLIVLLIDSDPHRTAIVQDGLKDRAVVRLANDLSSVGLLDRINELQPDAIIIDCDSPDRDTIENLRTVARENPKPIVMFVEDGDGTLAKEAVRAGVSAYIVDGLSRSRVLPVIEIAIERFKMVDGLWKELQKSKDDLETRKTVERAKGILMEKRGMSEKAAYDLMRESSMTSGKPLKQIAAEILSIADLLGKV